MSAVLINRKIPTGNTKEPESTRGPKPTDDNVRLFQPPQPKKKSIWCSGKTKTCMKVTGVVAAVLALGLSVSDELKKDLTTPSIERVPRADYNKLLNFTVHQSEKIKKLEKELRESKALVKKNKESGVLDTFKNAMKKAIRV